MKSPTLYRLHTFGCQMNAYDSEAVAGLLERDGWSATDDESEAGFILFNTCSVRQHAEDRVWGALNALRARAAREPGLLIGVLGCMAQLREDEIARRCPHVRLICGTGALHRLPTLVARAAVSGRTVIDIGTGPGAPPGGLPKKRAQRLKGFIPAMRGCDNYCAYCVVPRARGPETSRPPGEILIEAEALARDGCREITLLGQNVNSYRSGGLGFSGLLEAVSGVGGLERVRFMTSHPKDFPDELIRALARLPKVCEHLHLPLQSGSDTVLGRMNRKYTLGAYRELAGRLRAAVPGISLTTDLIAGFPGEGEEDFRRTLEAVGELRFDGSFIFKYSDREGTAAAGFEPKVPRETVERRHAELLKVQERISLERNRELIGSRVEVLVEGPSPRDPARLFGRTRTNKRVAFAGTAELSGRLVYVIIAGVTSLTLIGAAEGGRAG